MSDLTLTASYYEICKVTLFPGGTLKDETLDLDAIPEGTMIVFVLDVPKNHYVTIFELNGDDFSPSAEPLSYNKAGNEFTFELTTDIEVTAFETAARAVFWIKEIKQLNYSNTIVKGEVVSGTIKLNDTLYQPESSLEPKVVGIKKDGVEVEEANTGDVVALQLLDDYI